MHELFTSTPLVFLIVLGFCVLLGILVSRLSAKRKEESYGMKQAYACGESSIDHMIQPDYSQFFSFALFFTILHVVALVVATLPKSDLTAVVVAIIYVFLAGTGLLMLLRR